MRRACCLRPGIGVARRGPGRCRAVGLSGERTALACEGRPVPAGATLPSPPCIHPPLPLLVLPPPTFTQVANVVDKAEVVREGWNGFNVLHDAAARVAALDVGFLPSARARASKGELPGLLALMLGAGPACGRANLWLAWREPPGSCQGGDRQGSRLGPQPSALPARASSAWHAGPCLWGLLRAARSWYPQPRLSRPTPRSAPLLSSAPPCSRPQAGVPAGRRRLQRRRRAGGCLCDLPGACGCLVCGVVAYYGMYWHTLVGM